MDKDVKWQLGRTNASHVLVYFFELEDGKLNLLTYAVNKKDEDLEDKLLKFEKTREGFNRWCSKDDLSNIGRTISEWMKTHYTKIGLEE